MKDKLAKSIPLLAIFLVMAFIFRLPHAESQSPSQVRSVVGAWTGLGRLRNTNIITVINVEFTRADSEIAGEWYERINDQEFIRLRLRGTEDATGASVRVDSVEQKGGGSRLCSSFSSVKFNPTAAGELYANLNFPSRWSNAPGCTTESIELVSNANPKFAEIVEALYRGHAAQDRRNFGEAINQYKIAAEDGNGHAAFAIGYIYTGDARVTGIPNDPSEARRWYIKSIERNYMPARHYMICDGTRTKDSMIQLINNLFDDPSFTAAKLFGALASYFLTDPDVFRTYSFGPTADFAEAAEDEFMESPFLCNLIYHMHPSIRNPGNADANDMVGLGLLSNLLVQTPFAMKFNLSVGGGGACLIEMDSQYASKKFTATLAHCDEP
jgi:TPR repeat protein